MKKLSRSAAFLLLFVVINILAACAGHPSVRLHTPTSVPTPTNDPQSAARVVQAFWSALEAGDIETAMAYVHDDITCAGFCHFTGRQTFQSYLQGYLDAGYVTRIGDLKNIGNLVTYSWEVHRNGFFLRRGEDDEVMEVEDGKIVYWENYHR